MINPSLQSLKDHYISYLAKCILENWKWRHLKTRSYKKVPLRGFSKSPLAPMSSGNILAFRHLYLLVICLNFYLPHRTFKLFLNPSPCYWTKLVITCYAAKLLYWHQVIIKESVVSISRTQQGEAAHAQKTKLPESFQGTVFKSNIWG